MSQHYTVAWVAPEPQVWTSQHGKLMYTWMLKLEDDERNVQLNQLSETPPPRQGNVLYGRIEQRDYLKKDGSPGTSFKFQKEREPQKGAAQASRPEDPERQRRILRQHSQHMALLYCEIQGIRGKLPADFNLTKLSKIVDWFDTDVNQASPTSSGGAPTSAGEGNGVSLPATPPPSAPAVSEALTASEESW